MLAEATTTEISKQKKPETFEENRMVAIEGGEAYKEDDKVICKVLVKLPPYMSAFEVGTSFFNPKSLTENHYLTFGHNTLEYLKNYPFITVKAI